MKKSLEQQPKKEQQKYNYSLYSEKFAVTHLNQNSLISGVKSMHSKKFRALYIYTFL